MKSSLSTVTEAQLSSPPPPPSLRSPELQAEFLQAIQRRFQSHGEVEESTVISSSSSSPLSLTPSSSSSSSSPLSLTPSSSSSSSSPLSLTPSSSDRHALLSLSSSELLSELAASRLRPLRHVPAHKGLTIVFSGRGRQASGSTPSTAPANQIKR